MDQKLDKKKWGRLLAGPAFLFYTQRRVKLRLFLQQDP